MMMMMMIMTMTIGKNMTQETAAQNIKNQLKSSTENGEDRRTQG